MIRRRYLAGIFVKEQAASIKTALSAERETQTTILKS